MVDGDRAEARPRSGGADEAEIALGMPAVRWTAGRVARRSAPRLQQARAPRRVQRARPRAARRGRSRGRPYAALAALDVRSVRTLRKLSGARATQLGYVVDSVEALALRPPPGAHAHAAPRSSSSSATASTGATPLSRLRRPGELPRQPDPVPVLPRRGLQLHPLSTFKKANRCTASASAASRHVTRRSASPARRDDHSRRQALRRFIAWEYLFYFGGGLPAVDERDGSGHRHPGAGPCGHAARRAAYWPRRAGRSAPSRRRRRGACAPPARPAACTTSSTPTLPGCTSSTPSCSR